MEPDARPPDIVYSEPEMREFAVIVVWMSNGRAFRAGGPIRHHIAQAALSLARRVGQIPSGMLIYLERDVAAEIAQPAHAWLRGFIVGIIGSARTMRIKSFRAVSWSASALHRAD